MFENKAVKWTTTCMLSQSLWSLLNNHHHLSVICFFIITITKKHNKKNWRCCEFPAFASSSIKFYANVSSEIGSDRFGLIVSIYTCVSGSLVACKGASAWNNRFFTFAPLWGQRRVDGRQRSVVGLNRRERDFRKHCKSFDHLHTSQQVNKWKEGTEEHNNKQTPDITHFWTFWDFWLPGKQKQRRFP